MEFVLIRHTHCDVRPGLCYGHLDVALPASALDDIIQTVNQAPTVSAVFASSSTRCLSLARHLAQRDQCTLHVLDDLRELHFGDWEGLSWDEIPRGLSDPWADDPWHRAPPAGESESTLFERVQRALHIVMNERLDRVAIVSHAGPLRHLRCLLLGLPMSERWSWAIAPGEVRSVTRSL